MFSIVRHSLLEILRHIPKTGRGSVDRLNPPTKLNRSTTELLMIWRVNLTSICVMMVSFALPVSTDMMLRDIVFTWAQKWTISKSPSVAFLLAVLTTRPVLVLILASYVMLIVLSQLANTWSISLLISYFDFLPPSTLVSQSAAYSNLLLQQLSKRCCSVVVGKIYFFKCHKCRWIKNRFVQKVAQS